LNDSIARPESESPPHRAVRWPKVVVTLMTGAAAFGLVVIQFFWAGDPKNQLSLSNLNSRVPALASMSWVDRDSYCTSLAAFARNLDLNLAPDARVFVTGMLGSTNFSRAGYYFFLKNYLFPRDVEISLDGRAVSGTDGFYGVPCDSPAVLQSKGFDLLVEVSDNEPNLIPLTKKGELDSK
jgi:hypothetical protein